MAYNERKYIKMTTPAAPFSWPKLDKPDFGTEQYPVEQGQFVVKVLLDREDEKHAAFIKKLEDRQEEIRQGALAEFDKLSKTAQIKLKKSNGGDGLDPASLWGIQYDEETEEELPVVTLKLTLPYQVTFKKGRRAGETITNKLPVFDAKGRPMKNVPAIGGGTIGKVSFSFEESGYFIEGSGLYGMKRRIEGVQILDLKTYGEKSAADLGFSAEEGYTHDDDMFVDEGDEDATDEDATDEDETTGESGADF